MCQCFLMLFTVLGILPYDALADPLIIHPIILRPRNFTMGYDDYIRYECRVLAPEHKVSDVRWYHDGALVTNSSMRSVSVGKLETMAGYVTYLEIRNLKDEDSGQYTCTASPSGDGTRDVIVVDDHVYLRLTDYRAAHWGEPCRIENGTKICVDLNTHCYLVRPPQKPSATGFSCQCTDDYPIYDPEQSVCLKGSNLGAQCHTAHQCTWFAEYTECMGGTCQCITGYTPNADGAECVKAFELGDPCIGDWQCELGSMQCVNSMCQYAEGESVSSGQVALLVLLSLTGLSLLIFLAYLVACHFRNRGLRSAESPSSVYIVPTRNNV